MDIKIQAIHFEASEKLQDFIVKKTTKRRKKCVKTKEMIDFRQKMNTLFGGVCFAAQKMIAFCG